MTTTRISEYQWKRLGLGIPKQPPYPSHGANGGQAYLTWCDERDRVEAKRQLALDELAHARVTADRGEEPPVWYSTLAVREWCLAIQERIRATVVELNDALPLRPTSGVVSLIAVTSAGKLEGATARLAEACALLEKHRARLERTPLDEPDAVEGVDEDDLPAIGVPASTSTGAAS